MREIEGGETRTGLKPKMENCLNDMRREIVKVNLWKWQIIWRKVKNILEETNLFSIHYYKYLQYFFILQYCIVYCQLFIPFYFYDFISFVMCFYHIYILYLYIKCVTSCAIQARKNVITFIIFLSSCAWYDVHTSKKKARTSLVFFRRRKGKGKQCMKERKEGKCQKKSFRRRHLFSAAAMVPSVILYSETVMLFILVHYLWKYKFTTQFLYRRFYFLYYIRIELLNKRQTNSLFPFILLLNFDIFY